MNNNSEQIGRYLQNEMNAEEKAAFEKQLTTDNELRRELFIQKQIVNAVKTAGLKNTFRKTVHRKLINQRLIQFGIPAIILIAAAFVFYAIKTNKLFHGERTSIQGAETFVINNAADTIIETGEGVVFAIPAHAFNSKSDKVQLEIKTAISPYNIMRQGLSTTNNGSLLQTAGMFYINGYENEKPLSLVKNIDVSVPANEINPVMQLFDGVMDSTGRINWINPKPVEKGLRTYDITTLDFYPLNYIPVVKALEKDYTNKEYTDSLYYSFSGYPEGRAAMINQPPGGKIFFQKCASCHIMGKDFTGPNLQGVLSRWPTKQALKEWILNWQNAVKKYPYAADAANWSPTSEQVFEGQLNNPELDALIKWLDEWQPQLKLRDTANKVSDIKTDTTSSLSDRLLFEGHPEIDPSRIRAIWDTKFNNTILATKEFEERLHFLHELCNAEYFQAYLEGMNKSMYEIDQWCADNSAGKIRKIFLEFAARKDGAVLLKEGMQAKLSEYFQKKYKAYRDASEKTLVKYRQQLARLNQIADDKRREQETRDYIREDKNFNEEFCKNLTDAYRQIGVKRNCKDTIPPQYYNVTIVDTGWKNLDVYVFDATTTRQSMSYTDPVSGKTASLTYKDVNITIEDQTQYDNVLVYLIPDSLSSFQRIEQQGNVFKESLNSLFKYDAIAIAYKGTQAFFYRQVNLQPGNYVFKLSSITEQEIKGQLKNYSREKGKNINTEFEYQLFEQQETIREIQVGKEEDFRLKIARAIFSCFREEGPNWPAKADSINQTE